MNLPDLSIRRPVTVLMVFILVVVLGAVSLSRLPMDLLPDLNIPVAAVLTTYEGAGPYEVESMVTRPLERNLATVSHVTGITSQSSTGQSIVVLEFDWGVDMDFAMLEVRERLDLIKGFLPEGAGDPVPVKFDPSLLAGMSLAVSGSTDLAELKRVAEEEIAPRLERIPGVAAVEVTGGLTRVINVDVNQEKLNAYGLSLQNVVQTLQAENLNLPGGHVQSGSLELVVRTLGEFTGVEEISRINLVTPGGALVRLGEVAEVSDTFREQAGYVLLNGEPAVGLSLSRETGANSVTVSRAVRRELASLRNDLDVGLKIAVIMDEAEFIEETIADLANNAVVGGLLAVLILLLFLRNIVSTLIIGLAIPISLITTFVLIYFGKLSINMMTLGGLALGVGMMVDNAIVVLENIYRFRQEGASLVEAARDGTSEVGMAITASTLTTMVVFLPVVFIKGFVSQLFKELALTVSFSLFASLVVALTLVPMLCSRFLRLRRAEEGKNEKKPGRFTAGLLRKYRLLLDWALRHRKLTLVLTTAVFFLSLALLSLIGMEFLPQMDQGQFTINIQMPRGTVLAETAAVVEKVDAVLAGIPEIETVMLTVGSGNITGIGGSGGAADRASYTVNLTGRRRRSVEEIVEEVRRGVAAITGATIEVHSASMFISGFGDQRLSLKVKGDDFATLERISGELAALVAQVEGTREVSSSLEEGRPELRLMVDRAKASTWGLNPYTIAAQIRTAVQGTTATRLRTGGGEYDVRVRLQRENIPKVDDLHGLMLSTPLGATVPLGEVASFITMQGPVSISREDQQRVVTVSSGLVGRDLGSIAREIQEIIDNYWLPPGYSVEIAGEAEQMFEAFNQLFFALGLAILFVYMIMAAQFESLLHPFTIMFTIPLALIGVVWALFLTGHNLSVPAIMGLVVLAGIVVNNGIVLVDYINILRRRGMSTYEAIMQAGPVRLRPILMTTLTTVLGLVPMSLGLGEGAEFRAPMAVTVIGGLTVSTFLTLVVIPVLYASFDALGARWHRRRRPELTAEG